MWTEVLGDARFYEFLLRVDTDLAEKVHSGRCSQCGGPLHVGHYPRKPRGGAVPGELLEAYAQRFSFCCGRRGCRVRATPPSLRFLGRRVYLAVVVTLVTAMRHGTTGARGATLAAAAKARVPLRTLLRWRTWWRETFPQTSVWNTLRGLVSPAPALRDLPLGILERISGVNVSERLARFLWHLGPLTTASCNCTARIPMGLASTQKM